MLADGAGLTSSVRSAVEDTAGVALSVTVNVYFVFDEAAVGVPLMVPVAASSVRPAGNGGATDHFNGAAPPLA